MSADNDQMIGKCSTISKPVYKYNLNYIGRLRNKSKISEEILVDHQRKDSPNKSFKEIQGSCDNQEFNQETSKMHKSLAQDCPNCTKKNDMIQDLNQLIEKKDTEIYYRDLEIDKLKYELNEQKQVIKKLQV